MYAQTGNAIATAKLTARQRLMDINEKLRSVIQLNVEFHERYHGAPSPVLGTSGPDKNPGPRGVEDELSFLEAQLERLADQSCKLSNIA